MRTHSLRDTRKKGALAPPALALWIALGTSVAQGNIWSQPFNHNQAHNAIGSFSDPYAPWRVPAHNTSLATSPGNMAVYVAPNGYSYQWPQPPFVGGPSFNAVHMSLITKGRYRGMVVVWNILPVLAKHPPFGLPALPSGQYMSFQPYSIVDFADTPTVLDPAPVNQAFRFRNFLLPLGVYSPGPAPTPDAQNLFCAGHAWSPFGDLIVAGGTDFGTNGVFFNGVIVTLAFNPRRPVSDYVGTTQTLYPGFVGMWQRGPDLKSKRWYPTNTLTHRLERTKDPINFPDGREVMTISGGSHDDDNHVATNVAANNPTWNSYEALVINQEAVLGNAGFVNDSVVVGSTPVFTWAGPGTTTLDATGEPPVHVDWLYEYPRIHLLSNGKLFFSGYAPRWASLDHDGGIGGSPLGWIKSGGQPAGTYSSNWQPRRIDAPSFLFPNLGGPQMNIVYRLGGGDEHWYLPITPGDIGSPNGTTPTMESIHATVPNATWQAAPPMPTTNGTNGGRFLTNAVTLPTGAILVVGGMHRAPNTTAGTMTPVYPAQIFEGGAWTTLSSNPFPIPSKRDYHSVGMLLADGRVAVAGGNARDFDYEIYSPPYLSLPKPTSVVFNPRRLSTQRWMPGSWTTTSNTRSNVHTRPSWN